MFNSKIRHTGIVSTGLSGIGKIVIIQCIANAKKLASYLRQEGM
jgi:hypothetical protein